MCGGQYLTVQEQTVGGLLEMDLRCIKVGGREGRHCETVGRAARNFFFQFFTATQGTQRKGKVGQRSFEAG